MMSAEAGQSHPEKGFHPMQELEKRALANLREAQDHFKHFEIGRRQQQIIWLKEDMEDVYSIEKRMRTKVRVLEDTFNQLMMQIETCQCSTSAASSVEALMTRRCLNAHTCLQAAHPMKEKLADMREALAILKEQEMRKVNIQIGHLREDLGYAYDVEAEMEQKTTELQDLFEKIEKHMKNDVDKDTGHPQNQAVPEQKVSWMWKVGGAVVGSTVLGLAAFGLYKCFNH